MADECKDAVVEQVRRDLLERSHMGIRKYGTTLADGKYTHLQYLRHAYEEALDLANYLQGAMQTENARLEAATGAGVRP